MKTLIEAYLLAFNEGGSDAVWTLVREQCPNNQDRQEEVDGIQAHGWFVQRHFNSDQAEGELDFVRFEPSHSSQEGVLTSQP